MGRVRPVAGLGLLACASLFCLFRDFEGRQWIAPVFLAALTALVLMTILTEWSVPWPLRVAIGTAAGFVFVGIFVVPESVSPSSLLPGPRAILQLGRSAWDRSMTAFSPVDPEPGYLLLATAAAWIGIVITEPAAASGRLVLPVGIWAGFFTYTSITGANEGRQVAVFTFAVGLIAFLVLTGFRSTESGSSPLRVLPGTSALAAVSLAGGLLLPGLAPGYGESGVVSFDQAGPAARTEISPVVQIKPRLTAGTEQRLFQVRSAAAPSSVPVYWRLLALDRFNGDAWHSSADYQQVRETVRSREPYRGAGFRIDQQFNIQDLGGPWLPAAYQAFSVAGVEASVDPYGTAMTIRPRLSEGLSYRVSSRVPSPRYEDLIAAPGSIGMERYLELESVSDRVREITLSLTGDAPTSYEKVLAISEHLRKFRYDESVPPGHSSDQLLEFLVRTKAGYCEQFAGAMAVMARAIGIPARVAVGFLPGDYNAINGTYQVTSEHAHAWPEVFFSGIGWVPFEPTPRDIAIPPSYALAPVAETPGQPAQAEPPPAETAPPPQAQPNPVPDQPEEAPEQSEASRRQSPLLVPALILAVAIMLVAVLIFTKHSLRKRRSRAASAAERTNLAFRELEGTALDLSRPRKPGQTPKEFTSGLLAEYSLDAESAWRLMEIFEAATYGDEDPTDAEADEAWTAASRLRSEIWDQSDWKSKTALLVSPRSVLAQRKA